MNEDIPIQKEGEDLMITFNPKLIIDVLRVLEDENVSLYFTSPKLPCFIRDDNNTYIYIVMPVSQ